MALNAHNEGVGAQNGALDGLYTQNRITLWWGTRSGSAIKCENLKSVTNPRYSERWIWIRTKVMRNRNPALFCIYWYKTEFSFCSVKEKKVSLGFFSTSKKALQNNICHCWKLQLKIVLICWGCGVQRAAWTSPPLSGQPSPGSHQASNILF